VIGDSASAVRALEQTSAAATATGDAFKGLAVEADAAAASIVRVSAARADTLLAQSASLKQMASSGSLSATEQAVAGEAAIKRQTQAYKLLGIQAASTNASITQTAGTIGRGLTTYVTAPTAFVGYEAVKQALDFNQALLLIHSQAGASRAELEHMNQAVLQLVQSGRSYGQTAQSMAQGLYYIESEGIRGGQALSILQTAAAGAANGQTDMADTTNALTSAMKIFGDSAGGVAKTMATIDAVTATGKMHLEDLNNAFQTKFFTTAHQLGIPFEQAGAALDVFTKAGVPAQVAANNMTTSFIKMVTPAKAAIPYLAELGLTANTLGQALQHGGLSEALGKLAAGYQHIEETQSKFAANKAVLESFGGSRSGAPALALVQQYQSYMQSLGEIQRLNDPANFWTRVSQTMQQPAMQIKQDVAEISADFIKLGTALAPTVATLAGGISSIAGAFGSLPGPVKDAIGVIVGILAVGGPLGLAIKGIGTLAGGIGTAFEMMAARSGAAMTTVGAEADLAAAQMRVLAGAEGQAGAAAITAGAEGKAAFVSMLGPIAAAIAAVYALDKALKSLTGFDAIKKAWGSAGFFADNTASDTVRGKNPYPVGSSAWEEWEAGHMGLKRGTRDARIRVGGQSYTIGVVGGFGYEAGARSRERDERAAHRDHAHHETPSYHYTPVTGSSTTFALPPHFAVEFARAQAGVGNVTKEAEDVRRYLIREIHSGSLSGKALADAYKDLRTVNDLMASDTRKSAAAFKRQVSSDDVQLAQARNDIAVGELGAARVLLEKDRQRLEMLLQEAQTSEERTAVLRQLAEVNRMLHTKSDQFALSPRLQEEIAKADALAALHGGSGPDARQIYLAKEAKATAMHAIHSHELTLQGLIAAWQIVEQENSVLAQAKGAIDTYHAVSAKAIADSVKGLDHAQRLALQEQIAQSDAHRGYAPNPPGSHHTHHKVDVDVHVKSNDSHIVHVTKKHHRQSHQRAGGRR
jgi:TP901 family phage tail tape measure protein